MLVSEDRMREIERNYNLVMDEVTSINDYVARLCSPCIEDVTVFFGVGNGLTMAGTIARKRYYISLREFLSLAERYDGMGGDMLILNAHFVKSV